MFLSSGLVTSGLYDICGFWPFQNVIQWDSCEWHWAFSDWLLSPSEVELSFPCVQLLGGWPPATAPPYWDVIWVLLKDFIVSASLTWEVSSHQRGTGWPHILLPTPKVVLCIKLARLVLWKLPTLRNKLSLLPCGLWFLVSETGLPVSCAGPELLLEPPPWLSPLCLSVHVIYNFHHKLCTPQEFFLLSFLTPLWNLSVDSPLFRAE